VRSCGREVRDLRSDVNQFQGLSPLSSHVKNSNQHLSQLNYNKDIFDDSSHLFIKRYINSTKHRENHKIS
jgi:hypothetical protein